MNAVLSVAEAARVLGISKDLAYDLVEARQLPSFRFGNRLVVPRAPLEAMLAGAGGRTADARGAGLTSASAPP